MRVCVVNVCVWLYRWWRCSVVTRTTASWRRWTAPSSDSCTHTLAATIPRLQSPLACRASGSKNGDSLWRRMIYGRFLIRSWCSCVWWWRRLGTTIEKRHSSWKYGYLLWLGVSPQAQRLGVGKKLFSVSHPTTPQGRAAVTAPHIVPHIIDKRGESGRLHTDMPMGLLHEVPDEWSVVC